MSGRDFWNTFYTVTLFLFFLPIMLYISSTTLACIRPLAICLSAIAYFLSPFSVTPDPCIRA